MPDWIRRLVSPEIARLQGEVTTAKAQLTQAEVERDWWRRSAEGLGGTLTDVRRELQAEIKRNRRREDELIEQIIKLGGGRGLVPRQLDFDAKERAVSENAKPAELTAIQQEQLRDRAFMTLEQRFPGEQVTPEMVEAQYQAMLEDPMDWLIDD